MDIAHIAHVAALVKAGNEIRSRTEKMAMYVAESFTYHRGLRQESV